MSAAPQYQGEDGMEHVTDYLKSDDPATVAKFALAIEGALMALPSSPPRKSGVDPFFILPLTATLISRWAQKTAHLENAMCEGLTDERRIPEEMAAVIEPIKSSSEIRS
jgi:hypothetical protein